jgi:hypothetical protein
MPSPIYTLDLALMPPGKMTFDLFSGGIEGGRNIGPGFGAAINIFGSGLHTCKFTGIKSSPESPSNLRYLSKIARVTSGGVRPIDIPILTDFFAPLPIATPFVSIDQLYATSSYDDDALFDDDTPFSQPVITAHAGASAAINAGTITIVMDGLLNKLEGGEIFSINHPNKGPRVYGISDIDSVTVGASSITYVVGIVPTLREAIINGMDINFVRPTCRMRAAPGSTLPLDIQAWWDNSAEFSLVEAP